MPTAIAATGRAYVAQHFAGLAIKISAHTNDPGEALAQNELATGGGRAYAQQTFAAAGFSADADTTDNDDALAVFTPNNVDVGDPATIVRYIGVRLAGAGAGGADVIYARVRLAAPITLVTGVPFEIAAGTLDFMFRNAA